MRTVLHLSDLHFGRVDDSLVEPLIAAARTLAPDLVVVSGDFTQRARRREYREARTFLKRLPEPQLVVPGNHDIPLWDVIRRFGRFPHRNAILGRTTTADEQEYLDQGGFAGGSLIEPKSAL